MMSSNTDNDLRVVTLHPEDRTVRTLCTSHLNTEGLSNGGRDTAAHHIGGHSRGTLQGRRDHQQSGLNLRRPHYSTDLGRGKRMRKHVGGGWVCKACRRGLLRSWTGTGHSWGSGVLACSPTPRNTGYVVQRAVFPRVFRLAQAATSPRARNRSDFIYILYM